MDANTGLAILGTAIGSAKVVEKMLGPTADYIGGGLKNWTEKRVANVGRIFAKARKHLGTKIDSEGAVPPRVLKGILDEGSFCDDELAADYFGGVLASSRSEIPRDDRGAYFISLVSRLTTYQIRTHYFFYNLIKLIYDGEDWNIGIPQDRAKLQTFVPFTSYHHAMEFSPNEVFQVLLSHAIVGLAKEGLIAENYSSGAIEHLRGTYRGDFELTEAGIIFTPSLLGFELFHWACGKGDTSILNFLRPEVTFTSGVKIETSPGFKRTWLRKEKVETEVDANQPPPSND